MRLKEVLKKVKVHHWLMLAVLIAISSSLIVSNIFVRKNIEQVGMSKIKEDIKRVAETVAKEEFIIESVKERNNQETIQGYTLNLTHATNTDFIVVLDTEGIRFSHPKSEVVGKPFSNMKEAKRVLGGDDYYSRQVGVLGEGYRYFIPIKDKQNNIVGAVCVGLTQKNIKAENDSLLAPLKFGWLIGVLIGLVLTTIIAYRLKKVLLGLEPSELALRFVEKDIINDEIDEGIVAISLNGEVVLMNLSFREMFPEAVIKKGESSYLDKELVKSLFGGTVGSKIKSKNEVMYLNGLELLVSKSPIIINKKVTGAVATIRNQSEFKQLMFELSGTQQYIDSLRSQTHEFMNKLYIVSGLIELDQYEEAKHYIASVQEKHQKEIGDFSTKIKNPVMLGFLIGKVNEANEKHITVELTEETYIPDIVMGTSGYSFLQVIGNLIDNAIEAITKVNQKEATILLEFTYDESSRSIFATVANDGPQIKMKPVESVFWKQTSTKGKGRGYGLYICKGIVESHKGTISVQSTEEETEFTLEFPLIEG